MNTEEMDEWRELHFKTKKDCTENVWQSAGRLLWWTWMPLGSQVRDQLWDQVMVQVMENTDEL